MLAYAPFAKGDLAAEADELSGLAAGVAVRLIIHYKGTRIQSFEGNIRVIVGIFSGNW